MTKVHRYDLDHGAISLRTQFEQSIIEEKKSFNYLIITHH